jgi:hypothetical protein
VVLAAAVVVRGASARPAPPPGAALEAEIRADMADQHAIAWSSGVSLTWTDFQQDAPASPGAEGAVTAYSLIYGVRCVGSNFAARVTAAFFPRASWVRHDVLTDPEVSARTLHHEQFHFNLAEVYARRMRKYFAQLYDPCGKSDDRLGGSGSSYVVNAAAAQQRYDEETRHGLDATHQLMWDKDIADDLGSLADFAVPSDR